MFGQVDIPKGTYNGQKLIKLVKTKIPAKKTTSAATIARAAGSKGKAPGGKLAPVEGKKGRGRPKKELTAHKDLEEIKGKTTSVLEKVETSLPDDIDAELDIEVEGDVDITLDALTPELDDAVEALDVETLDDDLDDEDFAEDLVEEADEELDLTEDLSEELGTEKFFRETEPPVEDDEEKIPRSW